MIVSTYLSTIMLNVNGSNTAVKIYRDWKNTKRRPIRVYAAYKRLTRSKCMRDWSEEVWKIFLQVETKKGEQQLLLLDKINFKTKTLTKDKEGHSLHNDQGIDPGRRYNNSLKSTFTPIIEAPKILTDIKREIDSDTIIIGTLIHTPFTTKDRLSRQNINKKTLALKLKLDPLAY